MWFDLLGQTHPISIECAYLIRCSPWYWVLTALHKQATRHNNTKYNIVNLQLVANKNVANWSSDQLFVDVSTCRVLNFVHAVSKWVKCWENCKSLVLDIRWKVSADQRNHCRLLMLLLIKLISPVDNSIIGCYILLLANSLNGVSRWKDNLGNKSNCH